MFEVHHMKRTEFDTAVEWALAEGWNLGFEDADCFWTTDPFGFFVGKLDGVPVTAMSAVRYDQTFAFVGFYLCHPEHRGRGLGLQTWQHVMDDLDVATVGLDSVVQQQDNYIKSGFAPAHRNIRYQGTPVANPVPKIDIRTMGSDRLRVVDHYDRACFGCDRLAFLETWLSARGHLILGVWEKETLQGYGVARPCHNGTRIGPLFADNGDIASALFDALIAGSDPGPVYLDVPEPNEAARAMAQQRGLDAVSETVRMYRGAAWDTPAREDLRHHHTRTRLRQRDLHYISRTACVQLASFETAPSSQVNPRPGPLGVTQPSTTSAGSTSTLPAISKNSSQCAVGVMGRTCALGSMNKWLDTGMDAASASPIARSQPVMPPIFIRSGIAKSHASAAIALAMSEGNHQVLAGLYGGQRRLSDAGVPLEILRMYRLLDPVQIIGRHGVQPPQCFAHGL